MTSSVADALVGKLIDGRYRVLSHLADGGMASVFVALDGRLDRHVALKIMRPGLALDPVFVDRFRSEARASARLSHPNVVAVFDQGEDDGEVFLAMELVEGKTLREVIHEEAPLTPREALAILEPILEALRAAHGAGLIHRDVKPENVIIRRDGEVKVADFGLARAITNQTTTSQSGVLLGTVSYLSPEQVERGSASPRSDIYAAGLLLFEMLTGRKAVTGETPIQIAYQHVHGSIPAPSTVSPGLPRELDAVVATATATAPEARFDSAADFLAAVRSTRNHLSAAALEVRGTAPPPADIARPSRDLHTRPLAIDPAPGSPHAPAGRADSAGPSDAAGRSVRAPLSRTAEEPVVSPTTAIPIGQRGDRRRRRWPAFLVLVLFLLGGAAGWWFLAGPGSRTVVPAVATHSLTDAQTALQRASLSWQTTEAFSESVAKGIVISGNPGAGSEVPKHAGVTLVVSKGPERYTVPDLAGAKADTVASVLSPLTLKVGKRTEAWSETVAAGAVISQTPAKGAAVKRSTPVDLVVSKGREPIAVPVVTGDPIDEATRKITAAELKVKRLADANSDTVPAGRVISQDPAEGTLFRGGEVSVTVSKGPVMVTVPRVLGQPVAQAQAALEKLGFTVEVRRPLGTFFELVRDQSVAPDTPAPKGSTIILTVV